MKIVDELPVMLVTEVVDLPPASEIEEPGEPGGLLFDNEENSIWLAII